MHLAGAADLGRGPVYIEQILPSWASSSKFVAETTLLDKISRIANHLIFGAGLCGLYALATGGTGLLAYASYLSLALVVRKIVSVFIGYCVYPIALQSFSFVRGDEISAAGRNEIEKLQVRGVIVKNVPLYKSGVRYDAYLLANPDTIENGKWTINALGNGMSMEEFISDKYHENSPFKCNTLLVNGPSAGQSRGWPTRYQMGAAFEAGLQFLEKEVKATHIVMHGLSLGGGMMGEAILQHDFTDGMNQGTHYLSISDRSFSYLSEAARPLVEMVVGDRVGTVVRSIFYLAGVELDGVAAAQKLSQLNIRQIVIQHTCSDLRRGSDGVIADRASLFFSLKDDQTLKDKTYLTSDEISHFFELPFDIRVSLYRGIHEFLGNPIS